MELTYEEAIEKLEKIVSSLEDGSAKLDDALKLYEEGISLIRQCTEKLNAAEQKVKMVQFTPDGEVKAVPFAGVENE